jgi:hypothetical protein
MKKCAMKKSDWQAYLTEDPEEGRSATVAEHLEKCPECRKEAEEIRKVMEGAGAVKAEIREALRSVDWDALPDRIADYVYDRASRPERASLGERPRVWFLQSRLRPVFAGLAMGLILGSLGMYLLLKNPSSSADRGKGFYASHEFLDRVELEMARRETVDYLEKSQYVLLDMFGTPGGPEATRAAVNAAQAKDLLSKKKYLNAQLEKFQMAKAKAICDQIEALFLELAQISDELPEAELAKIRKFVQDRQLLLKINLVKQELQRGV